MTAYNADDDFLKLREWIHENCGTGCPVRDESYRNAIGAAVHRILKFGWEPTVNLWSARDCLNAALIAGGEPAGCFLRTAFTRAIIEDDGEVLKRLLESPFIPESRLWFIKLFNALSGDEQHLIEAAQWLETVSGEELAIASLIIGRMHPQLAELQWLEKCPKENPRVAGEICKILLKNKAYKNLVGAYLRAHPEVELATPGL